MLEKVSSYIRDYHMLDDCKTLVLGVSGGADSVCLFRMMKQITEPLKIQLIVVHIEHGIRGEESIQDAQFVESLCKEHQVVYRTYSFPVLEIAQKTKESTEEAGRRLRYETFYKVAGEYEKSKIAIAHNQNDNAETILFHMARGSGIKGLTGIAPVRDLIIRPLLCLTRNEIEVWLETMQQEYRTDKTNFMDIYARNKIRLHILPELEEINEKAVAHIMELSKKVRETYDYIYAQAAEKLEDEQYVQKTDNGFMIRNKVMLEIPELLQEEMIYQILVHMRNAAKDITKEHVKSIRLLYMKQNSRKISLPGDIVATKVYEGIEIQIHNKHIEKSFQKTEELPEEKFEFKIFENHAGIGEIPKNEYTKWFDYDKIKNGLQIRTRQQGDYFVLDDSGYKKSLKKYFIEAKIKRELRDEIPLLADDGHILWIVGYRISAAYKITSETKRIIEVRFIGGKGQ